MSKPQNKPNDSTSKSTETGPAPDASSSSSANAPGSDGASVSSSSGETGKPSEPPSIELSTLSKDLARRETELEERVQRFGHMQDEDAKRRVFVVQGLLVSFPDHPSLGGKELVIRLEGQVTGTLKLVVPYQYCDQLKLEPGDRVSLEVARR